MNFEIKLTDKELQILDEALVQLPFYKVAELINNINNQIEAQINEEDNKQKQTER